MAHRLVMIAIDGSDNSEKAFQCMGGSTSAITLNWTWNCYKIILSVKEIWLTMLDNVILSHHIEETKQALKATVSMEEENLSSM